MIKKMGLLITIFSIVFTSVAFAQSSASYDGWFASNVTTVSSIDTTDGYIYVNHNQTNTLGRNVKISALKKYSTGYSIYCPLKNYASDGNFDFYASLQSGNYKLKFERTTGDSTWGNIYIDGYFND